jgi:hypothetical protein
VSVNIAADLDELLAHFLEAAFDLLHVFALRAYAAVTLQVSIKRVSVPALIEPCVLPTAVVPQLACRLQDHDR